MMGSKLSPDTALPLGEVGVVRRETSSVPRAEDPSTCPWGRPVGSTCHRPGCSTSRQNRGLAGPGPKWTHGEAAEAGSARRVSPGGPAAAHLPRGPGVAAELQDQDVGRGEHEEQDRFGQGGHSQEDGQWECVHQAAEQGVGHRRAGHSGHRPPGVRTTRVLLGLELQAQGRQPTWRGQRGGGGRDGGGGGGWGGG